MSELLAWTRDRYLAYRRITSLSRIGALDRTLWDLAIRSLER